MLGYPEPLRALVLGALYASAALATPPQISSFFDRRASSDEAVCGAANYSQCPQANLPSNFCCPSDQACIPAAANTTVVCCPGGGDCRVIEPVKCDLNEANPSNPTALWKTEALDGSLPQCGLGCCPWGWSCDNEGHCIKDDDQSQVPEGAILPSTSTSAIPSATISPKPTSTSEADPATSEGSTSEPQPADGSQRKGLSGPATAGLIAGIVLAILCAALIFFITARRRKQKDQGDHDRTTSSFGNIISEPILQGGIGAIRSDFGRAQESRVASAGTGSTTVMGRPSIEGYWGSIGKPKPQMSESSRGTTPVRMNTGKSATGAPQISPIDMNDPFHDHHGLAISDDEAINPPTQRGATAVPPIRSMKNKRPSSGDNSRLRPYPRPYTPPRQREPSGVEINVFADPDTVADSPGMNIARSRFSRETRNTTFTEMMEKADLGDVNRGAPYVPKSAHNSPRRK